MTIRIVPLTAQANAGIFRDVLNTILEIIQGGAPPSPEPGGGTLTPADSGTTYTNAGASAITPFVLPEAASGLNFEFVVADADGIRVTAQAGDTLQVSSAVSASGGKAESTVVGSVLALLAIDTSQWVARSAVGTWVVT